VKCFSTQGFELKIRQNTQPTEVDRLTETLSRMRTYSAKSHRAEQSTEVAQVEAAALTPSVPECFYPQHQGLKKEGRTARAHNLTVKHSVFKLAVMGRLISG